jgi:thiamine pyrophosphate-dependent acetolactate synthase large subunit-like protein
LIMEISNGGEILVQALARQGVKKVFSIIGGQMGTMYDAIGRHPDMEVITPRSEASAALMACGYTASTGEPCVSMATVGAGVVYETAGLVMAWLDYLPVLSIAPPGAELQDEAPPGKPSGLRPGSSLCAFHQV